LGFEFSPQFRYSVFDFGIWDFGFRVWVFGFGFSVFGFDCGRRPPWSLSRSIWWLHQDLAKGTFHTNGMNARISRDAPQRDSKKIAILATASRIWPFPSRAVGTLVTVDGQPANLGTNEAWFVAARMLGYILDP
jgi:hypothetical protein